MTSPDSDSGALTPHDAGAPGSPISLLDYWAQSDPDREALSGLSFSTPQRSSAWLRLSRGSLADRVANLAAQLRATGLSAGSIIAVQLPHGVESVVAMLAVWRAGYVPASLPMAWRERDIEAALEHVPVAALVGRFSTVEHLRSPLLSLEDVAGTRLRLAFGVPDAHSAIIPLDLSPDPARRERHGADMGTASGPDARNAPPTPPDLALLHFATRRNGLRVIPRSGQELIAAGLHIGLALGLGSNERILCAYPVSGITGVAGFLMPWLVTGSRLVLHPPSDVETLVPRLEGEGITCTALPASLLPRLPWGEHDLSALRVIGEVSVMPPSKGETGPGRASFSDSASKLRPMANVADIVLVALPAAEDESRASLPIGIAAAAELDGEKAVFLEARIQGSARNAGGAPLLSGYLALRGLMVPAAADALATFNPSAAPLNRDGFLVTGIRCSVGNAAMTRITCLPDPELARIGGLSLDFKDLDRLYASCPLVLDAAAFTIPDPVLGERICAAIVPKPGADWSQDAVLAYLRRMRVAPYLAPERIVTVDAIPRDANGCVLRAQFSATHMQPGACPESAGV